MFKQGAETVQQLKQRSEQLKSGNMTFVDDNYMEKMQLSTGKRPLGEEQTAKTISLEQKLLGNLLGPYYPQSQWLDEVHGATVTLGTRTRDLTPKDWQTTFGDGILAAVHKGTVKFFSQKLTKEQVDYEMTVDMTYQINFLNGLQSGNVVVPYLQPPLFKQGMNQQLCVDLTATPNTPQDRGTKRQTSDGNTKTKRSKANAITCAILEEQKKLVEECYKVAKAKK